MSDSETQPSPEQPTSFREKLLQFTERLDNLSQNGINQIRQGRRLKDDTNADTQPLQGRVIARKFAEELTIGVYGGVQTLTNMTRRVLEVGT